MNNCRPIRLRVLGSQAAIETEEKRCSCVQMFPSTLSREFKRTSANVNCDKASLTSDDTLGKTKGFLSDLEKLRH